MSDLCRWLHEQLEQLPLIKFPFRLEQLSDNGIYFFYENGEIWGHGDNKPRIVRIGTHKNGNFKSRIKEHFLLNESKMNFDFSKPAPKDRSVFRKNIGRALLNRENSPYLKIWNKDLIPKKNREKYSQLRNIQKEKEIENQVTTILRNNFSFKFIVVENESERMNSEGLERKLIGTISNCSLCKPSNNWLGQFSPKKEIRQSGLWLIQHLNSSSMSGGEKIIFEKSVNLTLPKNFVEIK